MKIDVSQFAKGCTCGRTHNILVKNIIIEKGAIGRLADLLAEKSYCKQGEPVIICDENTWNTAEHFLCGSLSQIKRICLSAQNLHADEKAVELVRENMPQNVGILVAIGSGTIHDITRFIAFEKGINFISVPTAASVDGFVSTVAAMTWGGLKKTFPAISPICVVADSDIFSNAPYRLTASGISDLLGKYIALADWKISNAVTGEYICERVCNLEYEALEQVCACIDDLYKGKLEAYEQLMYALLLSGLAMQMVGNSRPASGAEHHISHLIEMEVTNDTVEAYHGEKVGCGLLIAIATYKKAVQSLRNKTIVKSDYNGFEETLLQKYFGAKGLYDGIIKENTPDPLSDVNFDKVLMNADKIADIIEELPSCEKIESLMNEAGCIKHLSEIGLDESLGETLKKLSPYVRGRLTFMRIMKLIK